MSTQLSPREKLIVRYLLDFPDCFGWDIEQAVQCRYAPSALQNIEAKGIDILRRKKRYVSHTEEGIQSRYVVIYKIHPDSIQLAISLLEDQK